ncbi:glycosyltransferase family 2 protein [Cognatishimia sp. F0-27]|uniref:glycosyltransferase family 2 protein n=1 Tax=Cognatishimia sp. F0-27 TaxID=2816855 RepID=UPI001D0C9107|nr:glycosyltransferase family 2 protein [Cognatishimia sp. F0-27]MCC1493859.1 glycosyltransferase family 2 protein [Cognatishimia sp. F0-27]
MPVASIVVPAYNVQDTLSETIEALLKQSFEDFEIVIVNDGSSDGTADMAEAFRSDPRVRVVHQRNRGLAGARNSGIAAARGRYIGFCDADDLWLPEKLGTHIAHLDANRAVGVSYSGSALIDDEGALLGTAQKPRLTGVTAAHILKRNPVGNGSAPVIRRAVFDAIAYRPAHETERDWFFDETLRQSEDIECWLRIAITTPWGFEGVPGLLTRYRISSGALSANTDRQFATWQQMIDKLTPLAPTLFAKHGRAARAYQLRYLARRAICDRDAGRAMTLAKKSILQSSRPLIEEPRKTLETLLAAGLLYAGGSLALDVIAAAGDRKNV